MIHQPLGGARGQASDIEIQAREIMKMNSIGAARSVLQAKGVADI